MKANIKKKMDELAGGAESNYMEGVLDAQSPDNIFSNGFAAAHDIYQPIVDELLEALEVYALTEKDDRMTRDEIVESYEARIAITKAKETLGDEETSK